jgi:hypothetical protein
MYTKILGLLAGALVLGISLGGCEQTPITCRVAGASVGAFAMKYTLKSGDAACLGLPGELVGMEGYSGLGAVAEGGPDLSVKRIALQSESVGNLYYTMLDFEDCLGGDFIADNADKGLYAIGNFAEIEPDASASCVMPVSEPARISTLEVPEHPDCAFEDDPENPAPMTCFDGMMSADETGVDCGGTGCPSCVSQPAHDITYKWTNVNVHVTGTSPGTVMTADLEYSDIGCSATYSVTGLFPGVGCEGVDAEGNGTGMPDTAICKVAADPAAGIAVGSGINPALFDYVVCDPDLLLCVLNGTPLADLP